MKKFILLLLSSLALLAQTPKVYSSLGDGIYNHLYAIKNLKTIKSYEAQISTIDQYILEVNKAKKLGFAIESGLQKARFDEYLQTLRRLSKVNEQFIRGGKSSFEHSIQTKNNDLFIGIVNSGIIDTQGNKNIIMNYYNQHADDIDAQGVVQEFIDEEYERLHKDKPKKVFVDKDKIRKDRIKRLRANDKLKQEALEKKVLDEADEKKRLIIEEQKRELAL